MPLSEAKDGGALANGRMDAPLSDRGTEIAFRAQGTELFHLELSRENWFFPELIEFLWIHAWESSETQEIISVKSGISTNPGKNRKIARGAVLLTYSFAS